MEYEFTQTWTKEDYVAFSTNHMMISVFKLTNVILFTVSIGYLIVTPLFTGDFTFFFMGIAVFMFMVFFLLYTRYSAKRSYDRNIDLMTINFRLNEDGITYLNKEGELLRYWKDFFSFKETPLYFFIYFNRNNGMLLAKRDFSEEMTKYVIDNVTKNVDAKRIKLLK